MKKFIALCSALVLTACCAVSCKPNVIQSEDKDKAHHLYIGVFNGGYGKAWLEKAAEDFCKSYDDVQIIIDSDKKDELQTNNLKDQIDTYAYDLYISPTNYMQMVYDETHMAMDITDTVTSDISLKNGVSDTSIARRMKESFRNFYNVGTEEKPKYYAVPVGGSIWGLNYDYDLFEEKGLFISGYDEEEDELIFTTGKTGDKPKSVGRDGVAGTYDDGTPTTWSEFKQLLAEMKNKSVTPFIWAENMASYRYFFLMSLWADYEGKERMENALKMNGTEIDIYDTAKTDANDSKAHAAAMASKDRKVKITDKEGYYLSQMKGKAAALEFADLIMEKGYYDDRSLLPTTDFTQAQSFYVQSKKYSASNPKYNRVAFLLDGGHWYNEIKAYSDSFTKDNYPEYKDGRRFSVMPFPKFDTSENDTATYLYSSSQFAAFIRKNAKEAEYAKLFLQYLMTTDSIKNIAFTSGMTMFYDYKVTNEELAAMPYYYRVIEEINQSDKCALVNEQCNTAFYKNNTKYQIKQNLLWKGTYTNRDLTDAFIDFKDYTSLTPYSCIKAAEQYYVTDKHWEREYTFA